MGYRLSNPYSVPVMMDVSNPASCSRPSASQVEDYVMNPFATPGRVIGENGEPYAKRARPNAGPTPWGMVEAAPGPQAANPNPGKFANPTAMNGNNLAVLQGGVRRLLGDGSIQRALPVGRLPTPSDVGQATQTMANVGIKTIFLRGPVVADTKAYTLLDISQLDKYEPFFLARSDTTAAQTEAMRAQQVTPHAYPIVSYREMRWWGQNYQKVINDFPKLVGIRTKPTYTGVTTDREAIYSDGTRKDLDPNVKSSYSMPFFDAYKFSGVVLADMGVDNFGNRIDNNSPYPAFTGVKGGVAEIRNFWSPLVVPGMRIGFEEILDMRKCTRTYKYQAIAGGPDESHTVPEPIMVLGIIDGSCFEMLRSEYNKYLRGAAADAPDALAVRNKLTDLRNETLGFAGNAWVQLFDNATGIAPGPAPHRYNPQILAAGGLFKDIAQGVDTRDVYIKARLDQLVGSDSTLQVYKRAYRALPNPRTTDAAVRYAEGQVKRTRETLALDILNRGQQTVSVFPTHQDLLDLKQDFAEKTFISTLRPLAGRPSQPVQADLRQSIRSFVEDGPRRRTQSYPHGPVYGAQKDLIYGRRIYIGKVMELQETNMFSTTIREATPASYGPGYFTDGPTPYLSRLHIHLSPTVPMTADQRMRNL
jgi:hypothetical protein